MLTAGLPGKGWICKWGVDVFMQRKVKIRLCVCKATDFTDYLGEWVSVKRYHKQNNVPFQLSWAFLNHLQSLMGSDGLNYICSLVLSSQFKKFIILTSNETSLWLMTSLAEIGMNVGYWIFSCRHKPFYSVCYAECLLYGVLTINILRFLRWSHLIYIS